MPCPRIRFSIAVVEPTWLLPASCRCMPCASHVFLDFHIYEQAALDYLLHFVVLQSPDDRPDFETVIGRLRRMLAVETLARQPSGELEKLHLHNRFPWTAALQRSVHVWPPSVALLRL